MTNMTTDPARIALSIRQPWVELILVGRCELTDCIAFTPATWEEWRGRHHNPGPLTVTLRINPADTEYAAIYINGDTTLDDPRKKILLTEQAFHGLMFDVKEP